MPTKEKSYTCEQLVDSTNTPLPWAYKISNATLDRRMYEMAKKTNAISRYVTNDTPLDARYVRAYLTTERAQGQIIGQWEIDKQAKTIASGNEIPTEVPIVYAIRSGKTFAEGIGHAFTLAGIKPRIIGVSGSKHPKNSTRHGFDVPDEAIALANQSGKIVLCDGVLKKGETLSCMINSLKGKFKGRLLVANSAQELPKECPPLQMSGNKLYDTLTDLHTSDPDIAFEWAVGRRSSDISIANPLKVGDLQDWQSQRG